MKFFLTVLGVVLVIEGAPWFLTPLGMYKMVREMGRLSENKVRILGLISMLAGLSLVFIGVH